MAVSNKKRDQVKAARKLVKEALRSLSNLEAMAVNYVNRGKAAINGDV